MKYDYLIVGSGLFGATFAYLHINKVKMFSYRQTSTTRRKSVLRRKRRNKYS